MGRSLNNAGCFPGESLNLPHQSQNFYGVCRARVIDKEFLTERAAGVGRAFGQLTCDEVNASLDGGQARMAGIISPAVVLKLVHAALSFADGDGGEQPVVEVISVSGAKV